MTLDQRGNIYITNADGVSVFNKEGQQIDQIPIPEDWTANVTFGGKERNKLFITASKSVYLVDMKVKGAY
jgi:gluconolactonase